MTTHLVAKSPREAMQAEGLRPYCYRRRMIEAGRRHVYVGGKPRVIMFAPKAMIKAGMERVAR